MRGRVLGHVDRCTRTFCLPADDDVVGRIRGQLHAPDPRGVTGAVVAGGVVDGVVVAGHDARGRGDAGRQDHQLRVEVRLDGRFGCSG